MMNRELTACAIVALTAGGAAAQPIYDSVIRLGLYGGDNRRNSDGFERSFLTGGDGPSFLFGTSDMFATDGETGRDGWVYDGQTVHRLGLTGSQYREANGRRSSTVFRGRNGMVIGYTDRFNSSDRKVGQDGWVWHNGTHRRLGLSGPGYQRDDGIAYNSPSFIGENGWIAGWNERYSGNSFRGRAAWFDDGMQSQRLGFTSGDHSAYNGYQSSSINAINAAGQIAGNSWRFTGNSSTAAGQTAWLWQNGSYTTLGLSGSDYTSSSGLEYHQASRLNDAGIVAGSSYIYSGSTRLGADAWVYDGSSTRRVGLQGNDYQHADGRRNSGITAIDSQGRSLGVSTAYIGSTQGGDVWFDDGAQTHRIGLFGSGHTRDDGFRSSSINRTNSSLQAAGNSIRYDGSTYLGREAWVWTGLETVKTGLTGALYEQTSGAIESRIGLINETGDVTGSTQRYNQSSIYLGQDSWYFDAATGTTTALIGDVSSDGRATSFVTHLTDDGFALGAYDNFGEDRTTAVRHGFVFRPAIGFVDLGELVSGGLSVRGIELLSDARFGDAIEYLVAYGLENGQTGQSVYLLTPTPGGLGLLAIAGLAASSRRR